MKITNKFRLPDEIVNAILKERYLDPDEDPFDMSASTLVAPIQQTILKRRHPSRLVSRDVTDFFWQFMGSIAHSVLEEAWHESMGGMAERRLYMTVKVGNKELVLAGKMDNYSASQQVRDYKTCKVYKIQKGDYTDWEKQLNIYAELCVENEFPVSSLRIYALVFDWKKREIGQPGYPECPIVPIPLRLWDQAVRKQYIQHRAELLVAAEEMSDEELADKIPCSAHEMWQDFRDYAVMKKGSSRANKTFQDEESANAWMKEHACKANSCIDYVNYHIVKRMTGRKRCLEHCDAANVCVQHKRLLEEGK